MNADDSFSSLNDSDYENSENGLKGDDNNLDYYAILNIPRDATTEDIIKAYKHRCRIFHPDRHADIDDKVEAEKIFVQLRNAYTTLTDPKKRAIYDAVGMEGLDIHGWEVIERSNVSDDIRKQFEFLKRLREQEIMLSRIHPAGNFQAKVNCAGLFKTFREERFLPMFAGISISQSSECSLTSTDKISLYGRVKTENGSGDGHFQIAWKKSYSQKVQLENSISFHYAMMSYSFKLLRTVFSKAAIAIHPTLHFSPINGEFTPNLGLVYSQQLRSEVLGRIMYNFGKRNPSLTTSIIISELNRPKFIADLTLSPINPVAKLLYCKRYAQHESFYELACTFSFFNVTPSLNFERRIGRFSKFGCEMQFSYPSFLLLTHFKIKTGLTTYQLQLSLCDDSEDITRAFVYGTLIPYISFTIAKAIFHKPFEKFMRLFSDNSEEKQVNIFKKEEAIKVCHLMRPTAERIAKDEDRKHGLVILEAKYGEMANSGPSATQYILAGEKLIDVTVPLQAMVNDSQLRIYSNKAQLPGFYDPCPGKAKMLKVSYRFRDELHSCIVADENPLNIPLSIHRIQS
uniref:J domain-containing protein n=1 Tax=Parastrongyloides trichosuri TaxID=131310 RepID=A0A0N4ZNX4_PARTI